MYQAELAWKRRLSCRCKESKSEEVIQIIQHDLNLIWPPEQIFNKILKGIISFKNIYHWIYDETILLGDLGYLTQKGKPLSSRNVLNNL